MILVKISVKQKKKPSAYLPLVTFYIRKYYSEYFCCALVTGFGSLIYIEIFMSMEKQANNINYKNMNVYMLI